MPITSSYQQLSYSGNGVTNAFPVTWPYQLQTDLVVQTLVVSTSTTTTLVLGTDYTVSPTLNSPASTGTVVTTVAPPIGTDLLITRSVPVTQDTSWVPNDPNLSTSTMNAVDKLTMIIQDVINDPFQLTGDASTFLRGDNILANTLIGASGGVTLPADSTALFTAQQNAAASIKVAGGATSQTAFSYGVSGSANPWDARWVYDPNLPAIGWQFFGGPIKGTFDTTGLSVSGTVNATLFTGAADGSLITTGTIAPARLGSGSGAGNVFLNGLGQFTIPAGGGGVSTTTTAPFTISAVSSSQTVAVTATTGIVVGTQLQISDGTHSINGHVTNIASLNLTVVTDAINLGTAGNTMASGAAVQGSTFPGTNSLLISDSAVSSTSISELHFTGGSAAGAVGKPVVRSYISSIIGNVANVQSYLPGGITTGQLSFAGTDARVRAIYAANGSAAASETLSGGDGHVLRIQTGGATADFSTLLPSSFANGIIYPPFFQATNSPSAGQLPSYADATHFTWVNNTGIPGGGNASQFVRSDVSNTNVLDITSASSYSGLTGAHTGLLLAYGESNGNYASTFGNTNDGATFFWAGQVKTTGTWGPIGSVIFHNYVIGNNAGDVVSIAGGYTPIDTTPTESLYAPSIIRAPALRDTYGPLHQIHTVDFTALSGTVNVSLGNGSYQRLINFVSGVVLRPQDSTPVPISLTYASEMTWEINAPGSLVTFDSLITWANGASAPTLSSSGVNIIKVIRRQGQTQWIGEFIQPATGTGTVTSVSSGTGLTGGPVTSTGTLAIAAGGVTASLIANNTITDAQISSSAAINPAKLSRPGGTTQFLRADGAWAVPSGGGSGQLPITMSLNGSTSGMPASGAVTGIGLNQSTGMTITKSVSGGNVTYTLSSSGSGALPFYYVAVPSGNATTDTANINNALSSAASAGGGIVVLQAGTYQINSTITLESSGVSMIGTGAGSTSAGAIPTTGTVLLWTGATLSGNMFVSAASPPTIGVRLEGFCVAGGSVVTAQKAVGMSLLGIQNWSLRDLTFINFSSIALDMFAGSGSDSGIGHVSVDNLLIDVGSLYWLAHSGDPLSPSTAIGMRISGSTPSTADVYASSFNNIFIVHNYVGLYMGNSDSNAFVNFHTFAFANSVGPVDGVSAVPNRGVYVTDDSRLNRIFGCSSAIVAKNVGGYPTHTAQCSFYDVDFIDPGSIANQISCGTGCELLVVNGNSVVSGTHSGTYYYGPTSGGSGIYSILFNESLGKISLTNRSGTVTSF